jgi:predicted ester cyclase
MSEANKVLVRRWVEEIFNGHRVEVADDVVAAEFVEHALAPFGQQAPGQVDGPAHTRATVEFLRAQFPDVRMTIEAIAAEEDVVSVRVLATGTNLGPLNGMIPPTGRSFSAQQSHWFRVADGRIAEHWATRDDLSTMLQLGVIPRPGPPAAPPAGNGAGS